MSALSEEIPLDRLIHEPGRLAILTVLSSVRNADFVFLQRTTGLTKRSANWQRGSSRSSHG